MQAFIDAVRTAPTRDAVVKLLESAYSRGLIATDRPPRVVATANDWDLYVGVSLEEGPFGEFTVPLFRVESFNGRVIEEIYWQEADTVEDVMVKVANVVEREGQVGMPFDVGGFLLA